MDEQPRLIDDRRWYVCWFSSQGVKCTIAPTMELEAAEALAAEMNGSWPTLRHFVESVDGERPGTFPGGPVATQPRRA